MNSPWMKLLLVALLFTIGGFFIGRHWGGCSHGCGDTGHGHGSTQCMHGEGDGHGGKSCCKSGHDEGMGHGEGGGKACCKSHGNGHGEGQDDADSQTQVIIKGLKDADFQGDTTIAIDGGTVHVKRDGQKINVQVDMADSAKAKSTTVEVH